MWAHAAAAQRDRAERGRPRRAAAACCARARAICCAACAETRPAASLAWRSANLAAESAANNTSRLGVVRYAEQLRAAPFTLSPGGPRRRLLPPPGGDADGNAAGGRAVGDGRALPRRAQPTDGAGRGATGGLAGGAPRRRGSPLSATRPPSTRPTAASGAGWSRASTMRSRPRRGGGSSSARRACGARRWARWMSRTGRRRAVRRLKAEHGVDLEEVRA